MTSSPEQFPTEPEGLAPAGSPSLVELADGDAFDLLIAPVMKQIGDATVRMLAYNGSIPGPTLMVAQGSQAIINVTNQGDLDATVHWHGLRLDSRFDGTHMVQRPIGIGESFEYRLDFPDPGAYWYHPHIRQDYALEMGLYGNILVVAADPDYWPPAHREILLTLDDVLIEDGRITPFDRDRTTHAAMGRFGNQLLVAGETHFGLTVRQGEVVRFYLTNTANTRVFNVALRNARMKLVGGDSGRCEHEQFVDSVVLGPSQRVVVDALFESTGEAALEHRTPKRTYHLASITAEDGRADPAATAAFATLRTNPEMLAERERIAPYVATEPDKTLALVAEMDVEEPDGATVYVCPMHPEVVSDEPGNCPKCGMKLIPQTPAVVYTCPMHPEVVSDEPGNCPKCGMKLIPRAVVPDDQPPGDDATPAAYEHVEGAPHDHAADAIEWEDDMVEFNRGTTSANTRWKLIDRATGAAGPQIDWRFKVGDQVKIRLVNEMVSDHPMHHPFHIHGAGRFLVLARDAVVEPNLVWTDTVLITTGQVLDILLDVTHPGLWMAHCHIPEHHESGMMFNFRVAPASEPRTGGPSGMPA